MIALFGGIKGGTGKSTLAVSMAGMRAARGHATLLVDADRQRSSVVWNDLRADTDAARVVSMERLGASLHRDVSDMATRYDDVIIDAGGRDSRELRSALVVADCLYTPVEPSHLDVWSLEELNELVGNARSMNPDLRAFIVLNKVSTHPGLPETKDALAVASEFEELENAGLLLYFRVAYKRAVGLGLTPEEMESPDPKAVNELQALYHHVYATNTTQAPAPTDS